MKTCDVLVIGSGPGGYVCAIRAAQLGFDTVCVERESLGGICLNWGCIPTKALLRSAEVLELIQHAGDFGLKVDGVSYDFPAIIQRSRQIADKISKGVAYLFRKYKVTHVTGTAHLRGVPGQVQVAVSGGGTETIAARHIVIATGARAKSLPGVAIDGGRIIEYRKAMTLPQRPDRLVVIGAGAIGVEFASFYRSLGTEVTIVEFMPGLVPSEDHEVRAELERAFKKRGIKLLLGHKLTGARSAPGGVEVDIEARDGGQAQTLQADICLMAAGITPNTEELDVDAAGVKLGPRGFIQVDDQLNTTAAGIYALGDVIGRGLAHVAMSEGVYLAERLAGLDPPRVPYHATPACTYCHPEIASVGLTEEKAREQGIPLKIGRFPFRPLGKTMAAGEYPGFAKLMYDERDGSLVGAHLIGPAVTDLIAVPTLAKATEANAESLVYTITAHPTFAEILKEATEDALGHPIHI